MRLFEYNYVILFQGSLTKNEIIQISEGVYFCV